MSYTLSLQTNLREADLIPMEAKRAPTGTSQLSEEHGITRTREKISFVVEHFLGIHQLEPATGRLTLVHTARNPEYALQAPLGNDGRVHIDISTSAIRAPLIFELERMFKPPLTELNLLDMRDEHSGSTAESQIIENMRSKLQEWLREYQMSLEKSRMQKPIIENAFQNERKLYRPEDLQRIFGGDLYKTLTTEFAKARTIGPKK